MLLNSIGFNPSYNTKHSQNNLSFKAVGVADLGTHGGANVAIIVNGEGKIEKGTSLNSADAKLFRADLSKQWARALKGHEAEPNKLAQCLAGPITDGIWYGTNVKDSQGNSLAIPVTEIKKDIENEGINVENFVACNDGAFMGGAALKQIKEQGRDLNKLFTPGSETPFIFPGGGLGVGYIRGTKDTIDIVTTEKGHLNLNINENETVEAKLTSVPAMIKNFAEAVGLNEKQAGTLASTGMGNIVTQHTIKLDNEKEAEEIKTLRKTNLFKVQANDNTTTLVLKDIDKEQHNQAFIEASNKFYDGIGKVVHDYVAGGKTNKAILTGKFVGFILQHSRDLGEDPIEKIKQAVDKNSNHVCKNLIKSGLEIIHAPVKDGTSGGTMIANSKDDNNGAWFSINRDELKNI